MATAAVVSMLRVVRPGRSIPSAIVVEWIDEHPGTEVWQGFLYGADSVEPLVLVTAPLILLARLSWPPPGDVAVAYRGQRPEARGL